VDGSFQPHADLYFHFPEKGRLIPALALPIDLATNRLVWPDAFAGWPQALLSQTSRYVLDLCNGRPAVGQVIATGSFQSVFGAPTEQLLNGRSIPGLENYWTTAQVLNRYQWVERLVQNGRVLEVATGPGFGAAWLLERQAGVDCYVGVDLDDLAIGLARRLNPPNRARFHLGLLDTLPDTGFDWVLSLETIEHTPDPERFLMELKHRLAPGGRMLVSLPCERWHGFHLNPHHWSAWNYRRIRTFLEPHFGQIAFWRQGRPRFNENALDDTGHITPLQEVDVDWDEDYLMLLSEPREAPYRPRVVIQRRYARGDVLQATPIVRAIRDRLPDHTLVVSTDIDEVFAGNPHVDLLMATSSGFRPRADDLVVNLDEAYERRPKQHILAAYADVAGVPLPNPALELHLDCRDYQTVGSLLEQSGDAWQTVTRLVAVHMGVTPDRSWPFTYWQVLIAALNADPHLGVVVVGAGADFHPAAAVRVLDLVGRLDLRETAAAVAMADVLIGPDSALLHVAAAVGTSAVGLYGMVDPRLRIPFGADQIAVRSPVDCAGCLHELPAPNTNPRCKFSKSFCMEAIAPAPVITATLQKLGHSPTDSWRARLQLGGFTRLSMESVSPGYSGPHI
jgi:ADP-heptose:LPS heptosyltransferase